MTKSNVVLAVALTEAWLGNPHTRASIDDVLAFFVSAHAAIMGLEGTLEPSQAREDQPEAYSPAVSARKSLGKPDRIISMINGQPYRTLKRHIAAHGLTPEQYRLRYRLPSDYPMVASGYAKERSDAAKRHGLGRNPTAKPDEPPKQALAPEPAKKPLAKLDIVAAKAAAKKHLGTGE